MYLLEDFVRTYVMRTNRFRDGRVLCVILVIGLTVVLTSYNTEIHFFAQRMYENAYFALAPSAERAYEYGERHFDATHAADYDLDRAEYFFTKAERVDPKYPLLQHELARVAFLKGNFPLALERINKELLNNPHPSPSSYYVKGLIEGYVGEYASAITYFEAYLRTDSKNWAAINDYAWVLLKADRPRDALVALDWGLIYHPDNPWLLNSKATALFEMKQLEKAYDAAQLASQAIKNVTETEWSHAYPGNDPLIAGDGLAAFKKAVEENMHTIGLALEKEQSGMR